MAKFDEFESTSREDLIKLIIELREEFGVSATEKVHAELEEMRELCKKAIKQRDEATKLNKSHDFQYSWVIGCIILAVSSFFFVCAKDLVRK